MSNWADFAIQTLGYGQPTKIRPLGRSMEPRVQSGALVTLEPVGEHVLAVDDIVLVEVGGSTYLHLIKEVKEGLYLIGNNKGRTNGWVASDKIFGIATSVEP